jgi:hypothetical protein
MRVRGGTNGILSAIDSGRIDPENAALPEEPPPARKRLHGSDLRKYVQRDREREKRVAKRIKRRDESPY